MAGNKMGGLKRRLGVSGELEPGQMIEALNKRKANNLAEDNSQHGVSVKILI